MLIPRDGELLLSKISASAGDLHNSNSLLAQILNNCGQDPPRFYVYTFKARMSTNLKPAVGNLSSSNL